MKKFIIGFFIVAIMCGGINNKTSAKTSTKSTTQPTVTEIIVYKSDNKMELYNKKGELVKTYKVRTGLVPGCKTKEGDSKTPCGEYKITQKRNSNDGYVKFLHLNYPNAQDKAKGYTGSAIGIHYFNTDVAKNPDQMKGSAGCITVYKKSEILEINDLVGVGTKVIIKQ